MKIKDVEEKLKKISKRQKIIIVVLIVFFLLLALNVVHAKKKKYRAYKGVDTYYGMKDLSRYDGYETLFEEQEPTCSDIALDRCALRYELQEEINKCASEEIVRVRREARCRDGEGY